MLFRLKIPYSVTKRKAELTNYKSNSTLELKSGDKTRLINFEFYN